MSPLHCIAFLFVLCFTLTSSDEHTHKYETNEEVVLWMNTVGPYHNRQETYAYFSLPFCTGPKKSIDHYHETLGEALLGVELEISGFEIHFKEYEIYYGFMVCSTDLHAELKKAVADSLKAARWQGRGSLLSTSIFVYAITSPINGYFGGSLFARMGGKRWIRQMVMSAFLLPSLVCGTAFLINFIAIYYHASRAIPFGTMVAVTCICLFVILPLTLVGTVLGRNLSGQPNYPCRINAVPRPIPEKKWFMEPGVIICLGGILPFGSIFIEMYFIFTSFWAYKIYYVYGFMLLVFIILAIVTVCVTIVCTYFLLNAEDYRWQWTSFLSGASTAGYVYMYSFYYYFFKTKMYGLFQTAFYFGYMALFSVALGILCGTFGYVGTSIFVRKIYSTVKID
ncbi:Transmembrane 9 superfamily member 3 [Araneus ventricosus]|uniref:Transmembrane 9 superfamily member n=1 Tax=Araneus ventricosus TaxID=182803 RepID=A0A4Y2FX01_ARAVE|nr:Transmembrane 9 superfamily member 3 [Araneus ventricosus]